MTNRGLLSFRLRLHEMGAVGSDPIWYGFALIVLRLYGHRATLERYSSELDHFPTEPTWQNYFTIEVMVNCLLKFV